MNRLVRLIPACGLTLVCIMFSVANAANITYALNRTVGSATVAGTITTDGTIGSIGVPELVDWNLVLTNGTDTATLLGPLSGDNSTFLQTAASPLQGSATQLTQTISAGSSGWMFCLDLVSFPNTCNLGTQTTWRIQATGQFTETVEDVPLGGITEISGPSGNVGDTVVIGTAVPVPAAAWMFVSALGLLGWIRRKTL